MKNAYSRTWNMARKLTKVEKKTQTLFDLDMAKNTEKHGK
jgi:hypothetical protein